MPRFHRALSVCICVHLWLPRLCLSTFVALAAFTAVKMALPFLALKKFAVQSMFWGSRSTTLTTPAGVSTLESSALTNSRKGPGLAHLSRTWNR